MVVSSFNRLSIRCRWGRISVDAIEGLGKTSCALKMKAP
jgi:hypothetical protein